jgi:hypothetical protein
VEKNYTLNAETGRFKVTGQNARLIHTVVVEAIQKNWWLIALYAVANFIAIYVGAYAIQVSWLNAFVSFIMFIFSTWIGYAMMCKVVTTTNEVR